MPRFQPGAKPPVKPIGRILYSELMGQRNVYPEIPAKFDRVCDCRGFSDDRPFSVFKAADEADASPFKVVFCWTNEKPTTVKVRRQGEMREEYDNDTYYMMDILEEHPSKYAAQKSMRRFAEESFAKATVTKPLELGAICNCEGANGAKLRLGDLVRFVSCPGIIWRILSERKTNYDWSLKVEPIFSFLVDDGTDKVKEISQRDVSFYVHPLTLVELGTSYAKFGLVLQDEGRPKKQ